MSLFAELKRRNVFRAGIAYIVVAWLVLQVADVMIANIGAPGWVFSTILLVLGIGLPIALVLAWAFEMTPEGLRRDQSRSTDGAKSSGRQLDVLIFVVLLAAIAYFEWPSHTGRTPENAPQTSAVPEPPVPSETADRGKSVAVLPFVNMSADPDKEYFSDGITEEIINAVVKIPGVSVPARTSVFGFKGHQGDVRQVGQQLGVSHVLEGSIRSQGDEVRITAQLIKVDDGFHIWSQTYDRKLQNIFAVQEEIASAIADQLMGELGDVAMVPNRTRNMAAYDTYLQGRAALRQRDYSAVTLLEAATSIDPDFAPAWASLAIAYQSITENDVMAAEAAKEALSLDPDNVDALTALGSTYRQSQKWMESERHFERALAVDPNSAELLEDYAEFLNLVGRSREALAVTTRGVAIDPLLAPLVGAHAEALLSNDRAEEARRQVLDYLEADNDHFGLWMVSMPVWLSPGEDGRMQPLPPNPDVPAWSDPRIVVHIEESIDLARRTFTEPGPELTRQLKARFNAQTVKEAGDSLPTHIDRALLVHLGEVDHVIEADLADLSQFPSDMREWLWTPLFTTYRRHPRFPEILELTGLADYWDATEWPDWCHRNESGEVSCR